MSFWGDCQRALAINNNISICQIALLILFSVSFSLSFPLSLLFYGPSTFSGSSKAPGFYVLRSQVTHRERTSSLDLSLCVHCMCCIVIGHVISPHTHTHTQWENSSVCVFGKCETCPCQGCCKLSLQFCHFNFKQRCCIVVSLSLSLLFQLFRLLSISTLSVRYANFPI